MLIVYYITTIISKMRILGGGLGLGSVSENGVVITNMYPITNPIYYCLCNYIYIYIIYICIYIYIYII